MEQRMRSSLMRGALGALTILAAGVLASCDSRRTVGTGGGGGGDFLPPSIIITVPNEDGQVNVGSQLIATVKAAHPVSLKLVVDSMFVDGVPVRTDSTLFTSQTKSFERQLPVPLAGVRSGQQIRIVGYAMDGRQNVAVAQVVLTAYDTTGPRVQVTQPVANRTIRPGTLVDSVTVVASDSSGLAMVGYRFYTDSLITASSVPLGGDSIQIVPTATNATRRLQIQIPPTMPAGRYFIRGFATDLSAIRGHSSLVGIFVQDTLSPTSIMQVLNTQFQPRDTILVRDSVIVENVLHDNVGLSSVTIRGVATRGNPDLGPVDTIPLYSSASYIVPSGVTLTDTTVRRLMVPIDGASPTDTVVYFISTIVDRAGNRATVTRALRRVSGPKVDAIRPNDNEERARGEEITIELLATDADGVRTLGYTLAGTGFPDVVRDTAPPSRQDTLRLVHRFTIPDAAVIGSTILISPRATDLTNQSGVGPTRTILISAMTVDTTPPFVYQILPKRVELSDSLAIRATDRSRITRVGYTLRSLATGSTIATAERTLATPWPSDTTVRLRLADAGGLWVDSLTKYRGEQVVLWSYADDSLGNRGYSLQPSNLTDPERDVAESRLDTALLVFGATNALPMGGFGADIAVDPATHDVFVSNLSFNQLDVWKSSLGRFDGSLVRVGAQPWGMSIDTSGTQLLVANSGGTNISMVSLASRTEVRRINTPNTVTYDLSYSIDQASGRIRYSLSPPIDYSDRPQFVGQSQNGNIYYSTRPTSAARPGTIRRLDPEPIAWGTGIRVDTVAIRQVWQYGGPAEGRYVILNADGVSVTKGASNTDPDIVTICDHPFGRSQSASTCVSHEIVDTVVAQLRLTGADLEAPRDLSVTSLALTDTTFIAVGGDLRWLAFGEGATGRPGRVILVKDTLGTDPFQATYSDGIEVVDMTNNASDRVFGVALNMNSSMLGVHGTGAFFGDTALRLQGTVEMGGGAGIVFHPEHDGTGNLADPLKRVAFVAEGDTTIAILDTYFFRQRGTLPLKINVTGAIRAVLPTAAELAADPELAVKLFALTPSGMVVINVRRCDLDNDDTPCP
jgi:hypothetical protein